jgi:hypothetical protein
MTDTARKAELEKQMMQACIQKAEACVTLFDDAVYARRHIVHDCFKIRMRIAGLIRSIRYLELFHNMCCQDAVDPDALHALEEDVDLLYVLCCGLHGLCAYFQNNYGPVPELLLQKPSADLGVLCRELAPAASPDARADPGGRVQRLRCRP